MFFLKKKLNKQDLYQKIMELKYLIFAKRVSYVLPLHEIRITGNYLVGLLPEG